MAQNLFKTRYLPNVDGSESSTALTNSNCAFVHTYLGDDNTGNGTRQKPYRSISKANLKSVSYMLFRGVINEYFLTTKIIIGDDINQTLANNYSARPYPILTCTMASGMQPNGDNGGYYKVIFNSDEINYNPGTATRQYCLFKGSFTNNNPNRACNNNTYKGFFHAHSAVLTYSNSIITNVFHHGINCGEILFNVLFLSSCVFKYNGVNIVQPNFTNDSKANMDLLRANFASAIGTNGAALALTMFPLDSFGNERCLVVKQYKDGGTAKNVFNKYDTTLTGTITEAITANSAKKSIQLTVADSSKYPTTGDIFVPNAAGDGYEVFTYTSVTINTGELITFNGASYTFKVAHSNGATCTRYGDVIDYSLNPDLGNEALWASDVGGYVGAMRPAYDSIQSAMTSIVVVDESTGADTATEGDLIYLNSAGEFVFNNASTQTWNRFRDSVTKYIQLGSSFKGGGGTSTDGSPFGYYIGKKQNLIGTTKYYAGDTLTVGKWYKVFNDSAISVSNSIVYNSVQYLPEYTFCCITGVTTFSLLNAGAGTYVMEILADVMESIELMPVDMIAILTATLSGLVPTIPVASTSGFPSSGSLYIGGKTFVYTSIDATNFYGLSQDIGTVASGKDVGLISAFPKFSVPINGDCKLLYYTAAGATRYGKTAGNPVLFADLSIANMIADFGNISNKISCYDSWAISNADQEFFVLVDPSLDSPKSTYFATSIPNIRYFRRSINAHFDKPYDY